MNVGISVPRTDTYLSPPIWGDERLARSLQKFLGNQKGIGRVDLYGRGMTVSNDIDIVLCMNHDVKHRGKKTVLWYQNSNEHDLRSLTNEYDGIMFASDHHFQAADHDWSMNDFPIPYCLEYVCYSDPAEFPEMSRTKNVKIAYLGNNIKGPQNVERYLVPAIEFGLECYGSGWEHGPTAPVAKGALRGLMSSAQLYNNSEIVLSFHLDEHRKWGMPVCRPTEAMLCNALCITDEVGRDVWDHHVIFTDGDRDLADKLSYWTAHPEEVKKFIVGNREYAIENLTVEIQAFRVGEFLKKVMDS
jgi:hypothetical protein